MQAQSRPLYNVAERMNFDDRQAADELHRSSLVPVPAGAPAREPSPAPEASEALVKEPAQ